MSSITVQIELRNAPPPHNRSTVMIINTPEDVSKEELTNCINKNIPSAINFMMNTRNSQHLNEKDILVLFFSRLLKNKYNAEVYAISPEFTIAFGSLPDNPNIRGDIGETEEEEYD